MSKKPNGKLMIIVDGMAFEMQELTGRMRASISQMYEEVWSRTPNAHQIGTISTLEFFHSLGLKIAIFRDSTSTYGVVLVAAGPYVMDLYPKGNELFVVQIAWTAIVKGGQVTFFPKFKGRGDDSAIDWKKLATLVNKELKEYNFKL